MPNAIGSLTTQFTQQFPIVQLRVQIIKITLNYKCSFKLIDLCIILTSLHHPVNLLIFPLFYNVIQLIKFFLWDYHKAVKLPGIPSKVSIVPGSIQINNSPFELVLQINIRHNHKINGIKMLGFPLDIAWVRSSNDIFFALMIKYHAIIFMFDMLDIFLQ